MGREIKLSPDAELAETEKVHEHILQAAAHYGNPLTGENLEDLLGRDFIQKHLSLIFGTNLVGG